VNVTWCASVELITPSVVPLTTERGWTVLVGIERDGISGRAQRIAAAVVMTSDEVIDRR